MRVYALFDDAGYSTGDFFDEFAYPPVTLDVPVKPANATDDMPETLWPRVTQRVRRNDAIPAKAVEISEADRGAIVSAPQYHRWDGSTLVALPIPAPPSQMPVSVAQGMAIAGRLAATSNLSDLADKAAARGNLGLGEVATMSRADIIAAVRDAIEGKEF